MPAVGPQGSRTGPLIAAVIFLIGFVTSLIFAFVFGVALNKETERYKQLDDRSKLYYGQTTGARFDELKKDINNDPALDDKTMLGAAIKDSSDLAQFVAGSQSSTTRPTEAIGVVRNKLNDISGKLPSLSLPADVSVLDALDAIGEYAAAQQQLADQRKAVADDAAKKSESAIANAQITTDKAKQDSADAAAAVQKALDDNQKVHTDYQARLSQYAQTMDQERRSFNDELKKREISEGDLNKKISLKDQELEAARAKLQGKRISPEENIVRQADGQILSLSPDDNICYINLGAGDHILPGMTFAVYSRHEGIPPLGDGLSQENMPAGLGTIEVQQVDADTSQCRILPTSTGLNRISVGDLIANLVYDRNVKYNFRVYGNFNLSQSPHPTEAQGQRDREKIEALVRMWGGRLQSKVDIDTDFVVMGTEPEVQSFTADELTDPYNVRLKADQEAELKRYNDIITTARELHIPIMNQNRFLYFCGYYDQAQR
jgi:hypothetical protein